MNNLWHCLTQNNIVYFYYQKEIFKNIRTEWFGEVVDYRLLVDTALLAGEMMLSSGAETYRVEETVRHMLKVSQFEHCDTFVVSTSIMVSIANHDLDAISRAKSIEERSINLANIYYVNDLSRKLCRNEISVEETHQRLEQLLHEKQYHPKKVYGCMILSAMAFTILLGANFIDCLVAGFNAIFVIISQVLYNKVKLNDFVINMAVCCIMAILTCVFSVILPCSLNIEAVIAGSIMPLLPGVALTNATRDTLIGDYVSGTARFVEAFVIAASLAVGIAAGLAVGNYWFGGIL